jgi:hypothetical protein
MRSINPFGFFSALIVAALIVAAAALFGCATPHAHPIMICMSVGSGAIACIDKSELDAGMKQHMQEPQDEPLVPQQHTPLRKSSPREKHDGTGSM